MNLQEFCHNFTHDQYPLSNDPKLGSRLISPEYSKSAKEIKTYPLIHEELIFALVWSIDNHNDIYASMVPSAKPFCYHYYFDSSEMTQLHTHEYIELAYVVDGHFKQRILGKDIEFHKGELCLIDQNCLHQDYLQNQSATILFLGIANNMFKELIHENTATDKVNAFLQSAVMAQKDVQQYLHFRPAAPDSPDISYLENCLMMLLSELCHPDAGSDFICKGLLLRIIRCLSTRYEFSLSKEQRRTMSWIIFEDVSDYMKQHYKTVTLRDLVKLFHFQEDYFNRLIKDKTGMTYSAYLQHIRLEKAEQLLTSTKMTIDEISEAVGYHNKGYFYKIFTEKNGMKPSQFRK